MPVHAGQTYERGDVAIGPPDVEAVRRTFGDRPEARWLDDALARDDVYHFAISWRGELVGQIVLHDVDWQTGEALVAYHVFDPRYRGQGIGTAALSLLLEHVVERTDLARVVSITSRENVASQRIAQKCGFVYVGAPRENPIDGVVHAWERPTATIPPEDAWAYTPGHLRLVERARRDEEEGRVFRLSLRDLRRIAEQ